MRNFCLLFITTLVVSAATAQKKTDIKNIKNLCGCFEVEFKYAETFAPDEEYKYHKRERITQAIELVMPVEESKNKIVLQHMLIVNDTMVIKHWREDWEFEKPELLVYSGDYNWVKQPLNREQVKNKWTQTVWEVSDAPRYQGSSEWVIADDKTMWMNTTDAPLPRREYSKRKDYNILKRRNMIIIEENGWMHEQDNQKIVRQDGKDSLLAEEKGMNTYVRIDERTCAAAKKYWEKNKAYWAMVRKTWENYLAAHHTISVKPVLDGKPLHQVLFNIALQFESKKISSADAEIKIKSAFDSYVTERSVALD